MNNAWLHFENHLILVTVLAHLCLYHSVVCYETFLTMSSYSPIKCKTCVEPLAAKQHKDRCIKYLKWCHRREQCSGVLFREWRAGLLVKTASFVFPTCQKTSTSSTGLLAPATPDAKAMGNDLHACVSPSTTGSFQGSSPRNGKGDTAGGQIRQVLLRSVPSRHL